MASDSQPLPIVPDIFSPYSSDLAVNNSPAPFYTPECGCVAREDRDYSFIGEPYKRADPRYVQGLKKTITLGRFVPDA